MRMIRQLGTSVIESMVVIAIIAIILMIGVPSLQSWLVSSQVAAKTDAILNGLQLARTEAIRRNAKVEFSIASDSSWSVGCATAVADQDGDGIDDCPATIQSKPADEAGLVDDLTLVPYGASKVTFNGIGTLSPNQDGSESLSQVDVTKSSADESVTLRVLITLGGQSRICDPAIETEGDPRKC